MRAAYRAPPAQPKSSPSDGGCEPISNALLGAAGNNAASSASTRWPPRGSKNQWWARSVPPRSIFGEASEIGDIERGSSAVITVSFLPWLAYATKHCPPMSTRPIRLPEHLFCRHVKRCSGARLRMVIDTATRRWHSIFLYTYFPRDLTGSSMRSTHSRNDAVDGEGLPCESSCLQPTGDIRRTASSKKGNAGGISVQEGYLDNAGRAVTKHTVYDSEGHIIHGPHFRPGGFK